jgi:hypothetical protein
LIVNAFGSGTGLAAVRADAHLGRPPRLVD